MRVGSSHGLLFGGLLVALAAVTLASCGADPAGSGDGGNGGGGTGSCLSLPPGTLAEVTAQEPVVVRETTGMAMNTMEDGDSPLPGAPIGILARGPCGKVGLLMRDPGDETVDAYAAYVDITEAPAPAEAISPELPPSLALVSLFFDSDCAPFVVRADAQTGIQEYVRSNDGTWNKGALAALTAPGNGALGGLSAVSAWTETDGTAALLYMANAGGTPMLLLARRAAAAGSAWQTEWYPSPPAVEVKAARVDANGIVHALYTKTEFPCDPCDLGLYYGRLPVNGQWSEELMQKSQWGSPDDRFATEPSLAVTSTGEPMVAAGYQHRAITGSLGHSELRIYARSSGKWCFETVVDEADGYQGSDGSDFTGAAPFLALDASDRPHVVFGDLSQWHDANHYSNGVQGQLRYAVRTGSGWTVETLFAQKGQTESPKPLEGMVKPVLVVSGDGTEASAVGIQRLWQTDSIYNAEPVQVLFRSTLVRVQVTL